MKKHGFTLIEMTIVVVIIGILSAALIPRLLGSKARARDVARESDTRNVAAAIQVYVNDHNGVIPEAVYQEANTNHSRGLIPSALAQGSTLVSTIDNLSGALKGYITTMPHDPAQLGIASVQSDGTCRQVGNSYAYFSDRSRGMFAITSLKESNKGNSMGCNGVVETKKGLDLAYLGVGRNLIYSGEINTPWTGSLIDPNEPYYPKYKDPKDPLPTAGDNCFDVIDEGGVWTIANYHAESPSCPKSVTINSQIKGKIVGAIKANAFFNKGITYISVPSSIKNIGTSAFANNNLTTISIPSGITKIADGLYRNNAIASVTIPSSITSIGAHAFAHNNLTVFQVSDKLTSFAGNAVVENGPNNTSNGITDFSPSETQRWILVNKIWVKDTDENCFVVSNIGTITKYYDYQNNDPAFPACSRDVVIGSTIKGKTIVGIGSYTFDNKSIKSVILPSTLQTIEKAAFKNNFITAVTIPNGVLNISEQAFRDNDLKEIIIPDSVTFIGKEAFILNKLETVVIGNGVKSIGESAFNTRTRDQPHLERENKITSLTLGSSLEYIYDYAFNGQKLASITIPDKLKYIGLGVFRGNPLTTLHLPSSVEYLDPFAFSANGPAVAKFDIPFQGTYSPSITRFVPNTDQNWTFSVPENKWIKDGGADESCFQFVSGYIVGYDSSCPTDSITIPATIGGITVLGIADNALRSLGLQEVTILSGLQSIGENAFRDNLIATINIPNSVKTIGYSAFTKNKLISVTIGNGVTSIGESAFNGYTARATDEQFNQIQQLVLGNSVKTIGNSAFWGHHLTSLTIPNSVEVIGSSAFGGSWNPIDGKYGSNLSSLSLGNSVSTIGNSAFVDNNITSITIPDSVSSIGNYAFEGNKLTSVVIGNGVKTIGSNAFANGVSDGSENNIQTITRGNSLQTIGNGAFYGNFLSGTLNLPSTVQSVGDQAFAGNHFNKFNVSNILSTMAGSILVSNGPTKNSYGITDFVANTTQSRELVDRTWIKIGTGYNPPSCFGISAGKITSYGGRCPKAVDIPPIVNGQVVTSIGSYVFHNNGYTSVKIPNTVKTIEPFAFQYNSSLTSVDLGLGVETIGQGAFIFCGITSIILPDSLKVLGGDSFGNNPIKSLHLGSGLQDIGYRSFRGHSINSVVIPDSVTSIGYNAFDGGIGNSQMSSVVIGKGVKYIGTEAFIYNKISSLTLGTGLEHIDNKAFRGNKLTSVTLPSSLTKLGSEAFAENQLTTIALPASLTNLNGQAFRHNGPTSKSNEMVGFVPDGSIQNWKVIGNNWVKQ